MEGSQTGGSSAPEPIATQRISSSLGSEGEGSADPTLLPLGPVRVSYSLDGYTTGTLELAAKANTDDYEWKVVEPLAQDAPSASEQTNHVLTLVASEAQTEVASRGSGG